MSLSRTRAVSPMRPDLVAGVLAGNKNQSHRPMTLAAPRSQQGSNLFANAAGCGRQVPRLYLRRGHGLDYAIGAALPKATGPCLALTAMWQRF